MPYRDGIIANHTHVERAADQLNKAYLIHDLFDARHKTVNNNTASVLRILIRDAHFLPTNVTCYPAYHLLP